MGLNCNSNSTAVFMKKYRLRNITEAVRLMPNDESIKECLKFIGVDNDYELLISAVKKDGFLEFNAHYEEDNKARFGDWILPRGESDIKGKNLFMSFEDREFKKMYVEL